MDKCPECGSALALSMPQGWLVCLRGGCGFETPADVNPKETTEAYRNIRAIVAEWNGNLPGEMIERVGVLSAPWMQALSDKIDATLAKQEQSRKLFEMNRIAQRPSIKRKGWT